MGSETAQEGIEFQMIVGQNSRKHYRNEDNLHRPDLRGTAKKSKELEITERLAANYQQEGACETENYDGPEIDDNGDYDDYDDLGMASGDEFDDVMDTVFDDMEPAAQQFGRGLPDNNLESQQQRVNLDFKAYVANAEANFAPFTKKWTKAIKLMQILRKSKASLDTYDDIMKWHFIANNTLHKYEELGNTREFVSRKKLFKFLRVRYNMKEEYFSRTTRIMLPSSKTAIDIVWSDAAMQVQSMLTDPRIRQEDFLFFENGPFSPPPAHLDYISDINTGLSYTETYRKLITNPLKQILLPTPFYIDGAVTGQFSNLPITAFRFCLGIYNMRARNIDYFWRNLGYVPKVAAEKSRGRNMMMRSRHCDALMLHQDVIRGEGVPNHSKVKPIQDYHAMLDAVLDRYKDLQTTGIKFDWMYKGKMYPDTEFILFIPHIKADNEEADKLAGKYGSRSKHVAQICRFCTCPTMLSDRVTAHHMRKTVPMISNLVANGDREALKALSQHEFLNVFWHLRFGLHNKAGIHGGMPIDMLHTIMLGTYARSTECFFAQLGKKNNTSEAINDLSKEYGQILDRQSNRNMPKTKFSTGILHGKIMGKEHEGVLLCLATVLQSSLGKEILAGHSGVFGKKTPGSEDLLTDWIRVLGVLLGWLQWLKSPVMQKIHIEAARSRHRNLMYMIKTTLRRAKGMGMKIIKFHMILHICDDILNFGIPAALDTGTNESHHKLSKTAALLTQKKEETFIKQTSTRGEEVHLLNLAGEEMEGRPLWKYWEGHKHPEIVVPDDSGITTGGSTFVCHWDEDSGSYNLVSKLRDDDDAPLYVESDFVKFVANLQEKLGDSHTVEVRSQHKRHGEIFRSHMQFHGGVWRDWVLIDWGIAEDTPAKLWGFLDLTGLKQGEGTISYGGVNDLVPAMYAICEYADYAEEEEPDELHNLFTPLIKKVGRVTQGAVTKLKFYLVDCDAFIEPISVVPDIGGAPNAYFMVKGREEWQQDFEAWLLNPDVEDVTLSDDESEDEVDESDDDEDSASDNEMSEEDNASALVSSDDEGTDSDDQSEQSEASA